MAARELKARDTSLDEKALWMEKASWMEMKSCGQLRRRTSNSQLPGLVSTVDALNPARGKPLIAARLNLDR